MPANTNPIFSAQPIQTGSGAIGTVAHPRSNGSGSVTIGDMVNIFTAGPSGSFVQRVRLCGTGTTATSTNATVLRLYIGNDSGPVYTSQSALLYQELAVGALSVAQASTAPAYLEVPLNMGLESGSTLLVASQVANAANTSWHAIAFGGHYA